MLKAKMILSGVALLAVIGGAFAFKAARISHQFYEVDAANPNPALRLCTKTTNVFYSTTTTTTTAPQITTLPYYTTSVLEPVCPTTILFSAQ